MTCMDKIASNSNSIFLGSAGFSLSGSQFRVLLGQWRIYVYIVVYNVLTNRIRPLKSTAG